MNSKIEKDTSFSESKDILRKSKLSNKNFAESTKKSRLNYLFLVRGKDNGRVSDTNISFKTFLHILT
ncbi:hypothetical protein EDL79_02335 [Ehrlichia ruminantium]|uniref:Uncharacterized protein n=1 Tax=Ehrlichia ruminantium TaxID=779 RepID=A0AAE6UKQ4_EHRRU|nr:hypothetical protein [Ehrlichia ruminantium]QGR02485.1 hypothetical protein EDL81_02295 [Ehrlichia ruminantium]QGR03433.1 hypothetical protein EDL80_02480 [Ehrlichia ruminantium]QGR04335.1 hypothetical protein EDL79_02335 [Ehrlichia ruminantium]